MKILFDCTFLRNRQTGVDVTFLSLIKNILKIDAINQYIILTDHRFDTTVLRNQLKEYTNYKIVRIYCYYPIHIFISAFIIPFYLLFNKIDVYHNPYFFGPLFRISKTRVIITVHDVYHKTIPEKMNGLIKFLLNNFAVPAVQRADKVIVISEQTKSDVLKYYNILESKISLIHNCIEPKLATNSSQAKSILENNNITANKYILNIGTMIRSKGIDDLIKAYHLLLNETSSYNDIKLVFAGINDNEYLNEIKELIKSLALPQSNIMFLGYVSNQDLIDLYKNAALYISPSYYEGFGLTVLEAMQYNCPVIARNASSLPETIGNAGMLFNTVKELTEEVVEMLTNEVIRLEYIKRGHDQLARFSCENRANRTLALYSS